MFAVSRNDRVTGRTRVLSVSINTSAGAKATGALLGVKCAINIFLLYTRPERISLSQIGNPIVNEKAKCLDVLKIYGISPVKLNVIIMIIRAAVKDVIPFNLLPKVRDI